MGVPRDWVCPVCKRQSFEVRTILGHGVTTRHEQCVDVLMEVARDAEKAVKARGGHFNLKSRVKKAASNLYYSCYDY